MRAWSDQERGDWAELHPKHWSFPPPWDGRDDTWWPVAEVLAIEGVCQERSQPALLWPYGAAPIQSTNGEEGSSGAAAG